MLHCCLCLSSPVARAKIKHIMINECWLDSQLFNTGIGTGVRQRGRVVTAPNLNSIGRGFKSRSDC